MLRPGVHQSISVANNFLVICTIINNFHVHSRDMPETNIYIGTTDMVESLVPQKRFHEAYDWSSDSPTIG